MDTVSAQISGKVYLKHSMESMRKIQIRYVSSYHSKGKKGFVAALYEFTVSVINCFDANKFLVTPRNTWNLGITFEGLFNVFQSFNTWERCFQESKI